jgi:nitroimidazol reductase NimA-like FMN-containing flavoprotein (pyridoxamine 5'-phosphate oxidase superfamily)
MEDTKLHKAKKIIAKNIYLTLATANLKGQPWNSPVYFAFDQHYVLYWKSDKNAQHSQNIRENEKVFIVIYDSSVPFGEGEGIFIQAKAYELIDEEEIAKALSYHNDRVGKRLWEVEEFVGENPRRIYKAVPEKVWINQDSTENGKFVDRRVEVELLHNE